MLSLRPICAVTADRVLQLPLHQAQRSFIATNADSLALAQEHPPMRPRAIYLGGELIGFAMYAGPGSTGRQDTHVLYRLMIAAPWQDRGHGRAALKLLLAGWARSVPPGSRCITRPPMSQPERCMRPPDSSSRDWTPMAR